MQAFLALIPILLILLLMVGLRRSAALAGSLGFLAALAIGIWGFGLGTASFGQIGPVLAVGGVMTEAGFVALTILWIIFPALCIFELQTQSGAFETLRGSLSRLTDDPRLLALLVAWFFALFMEGAAGFGTPVALAAPILVRLGFEPVKAVTLALIGHAAGVSFGAVGTPVLPQIAVTDFSGLEIARATGLMHGVLGWILLAFVFRLAKPEGAVSHWRDWGWAGLAALCFLLPFLALASFTGPELPSLAGALIGAVVFIFILRRKRGAGGAGGEEVEGEGAMALLRSALPYLVLLALILVTRLSPPIKEALREVEIAWSLFDGFSGSVQPLYHPGTMLMLGFVIGGLAQGQGVGGLLQAAGRAAAKLAPVVIALVAMLALSRMMVHSGMIDALAQTAAESLGIVWPMLAPAVGILGTFVTGSATASNILFTDFQQATALALGLPVLQLIAAQGFGAAVGNIVCPHNVIAGGATVGLKGREGEVLRKTALACLVYALAGGALLFLLIRIG